MEKDEKVQEFKKQINNSSFTTAIEIRDKQVIVYVSDIAVTLLHIPSGRDKAVFIPIDEFVKRVINDSTGTTEKVDDNSTVNPE